MSTRSDDSATIQARRRVRAAYEPAIIDRVGKVLGAELYQYLSGALQHPAPALPWRHPPDLVREAQAFLDAAPQAPAPKLSAEQVAKQFCDLAREVLCRNLRLHSPNYMGHQVPASVPLAGLFDALGSVTNQVMAIYEMGPFATAIEKAMLATLGSYFGWPVGSFDAIATHGASLANATALLTARNVRYPDAWKRGLIGASGVGHDRRPAIVTSTDSHYSVARAAGIIGIGTDQVLRVPVDAKRRLRIDGLIQTLDRAAESGNEVFGIVASACATPIGAFDPLEEIAQIASDRRLWLHVDGAHGASSLLSRRHRHLVCGIERADSVTWDAHKMLFVPGLCAMLFYRDGAHAYQTFQQDAPYLFDPKAPGLAEYDSAVRTVECTKRAMVLGLWGLWAIFGPGLFEDLVDVTFDLAWQLHEMLSATDDFVPVHEPQCNILCFRYLPAELRQAAPQQVSELQLSLRRRMVESGEFYITSTKLDGVAALRVTLINPLTEAQHLQQLLHSLRATGQELLA